MTYQASPPPATAGVAGAGVPLTGVPLLRLTTDSSPVMLVLSLARPNALMSRESNCASELFTRTCASPAELSVPSVQVLGERPPEAGEPGLTEDVTLETVVVV